MRDSAEVRLGILTVLIPVASRVGITEPSQIVEIATILENYVLGSEEQGNNQPVPKPDRKQKLPTPKPKGKK